MSRHSGSLATAPTWALVSVVSVLLVSVAACRNDNGPSAAGGADTRTATPGSISGAEKAALRAVAAAYAADLAEVQSTGSEALGPGGDVAGFYERFAVAAREGAESYGELDIPGEIEAVRTRLVSLLAEQADVLDEIASGAAAGADDSLTPKLERLTELLGDVATTNAELLRSMDVNVSRSGTSVEQQIMTVPPAKRADGIAEESQ